MSDIEVINYNSTTGEQKSFSPRWWSEKKSNLHEHVIPLVAELERHQQQKYKKLRDYGSLYVNSPTLGNWTGAKRKLYSFRTRGRAGVTYNVIKSCVDTATSKIGTKRFKPMFLTHGGSIDLQNRAQLLTDYILSLYETMGTGTGENRSLYGVGTQTFREAATVGTGATKFFVCPYEKRVKAENIPFSEIVIDPHEALYQKPRQIHHKRVIDRHVLADMFSKPELKRQILKADSAKDYSDDGRQSDMVEVVESWRLPSGPDAGDGIHSICMEGVTLFSEKYEKNYLPFLFMRWTPAPIGFEGIGMAEELYGIQLEINKLLWLVSECQNRMAVPQIWLDIMSKGVNSNMSNKVGGIYYYSGQPPKMFVPQSMSSEIYSHIERLFSRAFEITGISMLSAAARKPGGLDSAVALREYKDTETERFAAVERMVESFYLDATNITIDMLREQREKGNDVIVKAVRQTGTAPLRFSDVDIPDDKLTCRPYPTGLLPSTPAGKLQKVQELVQSGFFSKSEGFALLDYPDIRKISDLKLAKTEVISKVIEEMLKKKKFIPPEPFMKPLELVLDTAQNYYLLGRTEDMDNERLELLVRFMNQTKALMDKQAEQQQPPPEAMPPEAGGEGGDMPPIANPEAPPESDLVPMA